MYSPVPNTSQLGEHSLIFNDVDFLLMKYHTDTMAHIGVSGLNPTPVHKWERRWEVGGGGSCSRAINLISGQMNAGELGNTKFTRLLMNTA